MSLLASTPMPIAASVRTDTEPVLLQRVLATRHLRSVYQPIVRLSDRRVVAFEAFARTADLPDDGSVTGLFQEAVRSGQLRDLDWLCRRTAIRGAREVPARLTLHLNVAVGCVSDPIGDAQKMATLAMSCGRHAEDIVLDITDALVTAPARLMVALVAYRREGFQIAMDGVSSARFLEVMPTIAPDIVKLDRSVTATIDSAPAARLVEAAVMAAQRIAAVVVAQGIETVDQVDAFRELGVSVGAGYLLGRPGPLTPLRGAVAS